MRRSLPILLAAALALPALVGCRRPPPAPEGLDDSIRALVRDFYSDDLVIGADLTGLETWFVDEGYALLDITPALDELGEFTLEPLRADDIALLTVADDGRDIALTQGAIGISEVGCSWGEAEALDVRPDQDVVFGGEWAEYSRTFLSSRSEFEEARAALEERVVSAGVDPRGEPWQDGELSGSFLDTSNAVHTSDLLVELDFGLVVHVRHGVFDVRGEEMQATVLLTYQPDRAVGEAGVYSLEQNYGVEVLLEREPGVTTRMAAIWSEVRGPLIEDDSALTLRSGIARMQRFAGRMTEICAGEVELPPEP